LKIRLLKQINHFQNLKEKALMVLDAIPDSMVRTSKIYKKRVENYTKTINNLLISYKKI
jgi:hypothetical protein